MALDILSFIIRSNVLIVGHNLSYDYQVIYRTFGLKIENVFDTMLAAQILECGKPTKKGHFTLESTTHRYYDPFAYSAQTYIGIPHVTKKVRDTFADFDELTDLHITYAAFDVYFAYCLHVKLEEALVAADMMKVAQLEFDFLKVASDMTINGLPINTSSWIKLAEKSQAKVDEYLANLALVAPINWNSWQQVSKVFKEKNIPIEYFDKKSGSIKESVSKTVLADVTDPLAKYYIEYKRFQKQASTYGLSFLEHVNSSTGRIHSSFFQIMDTGRTSSSKPNCYSGETEVLTPNGWVKLKDFKGECVAQWDSDGNLEFVQPTAYWKSREEVLKISNQQIHLEVTKDHRCLLQTRKGLLLEVSAENWAWDRKHFHAGILNSGEAYNLDTIRLAVAIQADAELTDTKVKFGFVKPRKIQRLTEILTRLNIPHSWSFSGNCLRCSFSKTLASDSLLFLTDKRFNSKILTSNLDGRKTFIEELFYWDGLFTRKNTYASKHESNIDIVQAVAATCNLRCRKRLYKNKYFNADFTDTNFSWTTNTKISSLGEKDVYCLSVPSS